MLTKSIRLTKDEAAELGRYTELTGEVEATALKRAALRGLRELRLEQALLTYLERHNSTAAAEIAGIPRGEFLQIVVDKGITILDGPSTLAEELLGLAEQLDDERLTAAAQRLADRVA